MWKILIDCYFVYCCYILALLVTVVRWSCWRIDSSVDTIATHKLLWKGEDVLLWSLIVIIRLGIFPFLAMNFDERSSVVACRTSWGRWWQTVDEVQIEVECEPLESAKLVVCSISNTTIMCLVKDKPVIQVSSQRPPSCTSILKLFQGTLFRTVKADDSTWTLGKLLVAFATAFRAGFVACIRMHVNDQAIRMFMY